MSQPLSFLHGLLILSIFFLNSMGTNSTTVSPPLCAPHQCGDVLISYPFSLLSDNATSDKLYCGYKGFGLTCSSAGEKPILALPNNPYYVTEINYTESTLTLVDIDAANESCPRVRHNITLGTLPLNFSTSDLNLIFYFNCSLYPASVPDIGCLGGYNANYRSFVFVDGNETTAGGFEWGNICEEKVVATVMRTEVDIGNLSSGGFIGAIKNGFVLDWKPLKDCDACQSSDGFCGYNNTGEDDKFLCFCGDGSINNGERCKDAGNLNFKVMIIVLDGKWPRISLWKCETTPFNK